MMLMGHDQVKLIMTINDLIVFFFFEKGPHCVGPTLDKLLEESTLSIISPKIITTFMT